MNQDLATALADARRRLSTQGLAPVPQASLSLRLPGEQAMLLLGAMDDGARRIELSGKLAGTAALHGAIYNLRSDIGAIGACGGPFGHALADVGGVLPPAFDEQARHLGRMRGPVKSIAPGELAAALGDGANVVMIQGVPVCMGTTCQRMIFNAELFEKCAKAYVLAASTGHAVTTLPWWVCRIANGRLRKDQRRAALRFAQGALPEELRGY